MKLKIQSSLALDSGHVSEKREDARRSERDLEQFLNAVSKYVQTEHLQKITDANIGQLDDCESSVSDHHCQCQCRY